MEDKITALERIKVFLKDTLGWIILLIILLVFALYRMDKDLTNLKEQNEKLNEQVKNAYNNGQDDCIRKTVEQMKVLQSIGTVLKQNNDIQKKQQEDDKKLIKQIDKLKTNIQ